MAPTDDTAHRSRHRAAGTDITVREPDEVESEDGVFEIRMPIASTGEVRNDGDDPLTRSELEGMARQIDERAVGVFPNHGMDSTVADDLYSPFERLGDWREGEFVERDSVEGEDGDGGVLMATARMPDPETLPAATGPYRQGLAVLKEQAARGIAQDASIAWRADDSFPGGNDLMEVSIVGIGADPRTNTGDEAATVARAAVDAGADPDDLLERVERAVASDADRDGDADADADSQTVTDDDDAADSDPPDGGTTDDAQDASDDGGDTDTRAPDDLTQDRLLTFAAVHFDGVDEEDFADLVANADAEFVGSANVEELYDLASVVTGADYDEVEAAMSDLMDGDDSEDDGDEQEGDKPDDDEDDEDDDEDRSADGDDSDDSGDEYEERIAALEDELAAVRSGEVDIDTPDADDEQDAADADADRSTEDGDGDGDDGETTEREAEDPTGGLGDYR